MPITKKTTAPAARAAQEAVAGAGAGGGGTAVSLRPSDQVSEGLIDDFDALFKELRFTLESPPGYAEKSSNDRVSLFVKAILVDQSDQKEYEHFWSAGDSSRFMPSEDGTSANRMKGSGGLGNSTNLAIVMRSIVDAGFPEDKITAEITCFEGMVAHMKRIAVARKGLLKQEGQREQTCLAVEKILKMPWENKQAAARPTAAKSSPTTSKATGAVTPSSNGDADVSDEALEVLMEVVEAEGKPVKKSALAVKSFKVLANHKESRTAILTLFKDDDMLLALAEAGGLTFDGETIAAAAE